MQNTETFNIYYIYKRNQNQYLYLPTWGTQENRSFQLLNCK